MPDRLEEGLRDQRIPRHVPVYISGDEVPLDGQLPSGRLKRRIQIEGWDVAAPGPFAPEQAAAAGLLRVVPS